MPCACLAKNLELIDMNMFLKDVKRFILKEKLYSVLLVLIIVFFVGVHSRQNTENTKSKETTAQSYKLSKEQVKNIEEQLKLKPETLKSFQVFTAAAFVVFCVGFLFNMIAVRRIFEQKELIPKAGQSPAVTWGISEIFKVVLLFIAFGIIVNFIFYILSMLFFKSKEGFSDIIFHTAIVDVLAVLFMWQAVKKSQGKFAYLFGGFKDRQLLKESFLGLISYITLLPVIVGLLLVLVYISNLCSYEPPPHPLVDMFMHEDQMPRWLLVASLGLACVGGPLIEEMFFRGFFYPAMRKYFGVLGAMGITSALFAGVHESLFSFLPIFLLSCVLCYLYEKRNSLVPSIMLHMTHNIVFISYFFVIKRLFF